MEKPLSKVSIDAIGDRLRSGDMSEEVLHKLAVYREMRRPFYETIMYALRDHLGLEPTGRPAKSNFSIRAKLLRQPTARLSQLDDVIGCRLVAQGAHDQVELIDALRDHFETRGRYKVRLNDRRAVPSHGYRAYHYILKDATGFPMEIQVRTQLQHLWAELCEKLSDTIDPAIKYGGGGSVVHDWLSYLSEQIRSTEESELVLERAHEEQVDDPNSERQSLIEELEATITSRHIDLRALMRQIPAELLDSEEKS